MEADELDEWADQWPITGPHEWAALLSRFLFLDVRIKNAHIAPYLFILFDELQVLWMGLVLVVMRFGSETDV